MSDKGECERECPCECECGNVATHACSRCKKAICDDSNCGQDTVDGYLCGSYTQSGCGRKYTTCDICLDDKAIHEGDMSFCVECTNYMCDGCAEDNICAICGNIVCGDCICDHDCANEKAKED